MKCSIQGIICMCKMNDTSLDGTRMKIFWYDAWKPEYFIARQWLARHVSAATDKLVETEQLLRNKRTFLWRCGFMETNLVWNAFSVSTDKQETSSTVTGDYISSCAEKNGWNLHSSFVLSDSWESSVGSQTTSCRVPSRKKMTVCQIVICELL
jgi:hypothetical protein